MLNQKSLVISGKNIPTQLPISWTACAFLLLDRFHASGICWGIVGTLFFFIWLGALYRLFTEDWVEIGDLLNSQRKSNGKSN